MWNNYPEVASELELVELFIRENTRSRNRLLSEIVEELLCSGGKRLRPAFVIAAARFGNYNRQKAVSVAGALEILHSATLVHDDIIDRAKLRRGRNTVSEKHGIDLAVYTGDFLFTKAVLMLSKDISIEKLDSVASAVKTICEGEVDQYIDKFNIDTSALSYLKRIAKKTAVLFSAACGLGAYTAECTEDVTRKLAKFGLYYGMAFQLRDDINDFVSNEKTEGKPVAKDLQEGVLTLPVILALRKEQKVREAVAAVFGQKAEMTGTDLLQVLQMVKDLKGIDEARLVLKKYTKRAMKILDTLPESSCSQMLRDLTARLE